MNTTDADALIAEIERRAKDERSLVAKLRAHQQSPMPTSRQAAEGHFLHDTVLNNDLDGVRSWYSKDVEALLALVRQLRKERDDAYATLYMLHGGK